MADFSTDTKNSHENGANHERKSADGPFGVRSYMEIQAAVELDRQSLPEQPNRNSENLPQGQDNSQYEVWLRKKMAEIEKEKSTEAWAIQELKSIDLDINKITSDTPDYIATNYRMYKKIIENKLLKARTGYQRAREKFEYVKMLQAQSGQAGAINNPLLLDMKAIAETASLIFGALDHWRPDKKAVHTALAGKSPTELAAIRASYKDQFDGHDLDSDIINKLSGADREEAEAQLSGNPIKAAAAALKNAAAGLGTDEAKIHETLAQINKLCAKDPNARHEVEKEFQARTGKSLATMLDEELSGSEFKVAQKEALGDKAGAEAIKLDDALHNTFWKNATRDTLLEVLVGPIGTDKDAVYTALEGCKTQKERDDLVKAYKDKTGKDLKQDVTVEMDGRAQELSLALLDADKTRAAVARLELASEGAGTDEGAIFKQFEGVKGTDREAILKAYEGKHGIGSFKAMLKDELDDTDAERALQLAEQGEMSRAFALQYAMKGLGTDEGMIRATLKKCKTKNEIEELIKAYAQITNGGILKNDLHGELSGRDDFEVGQLLQGSNCKDQKPEERAAFANAAYEFERGKQAGLIGNWAMDLVSDTGHMLKVQHERMAVLNKKLKAGEELTLKEQEQLETLSDYHRLAVENYQAAKDGFTNLAALGGTAIIGLAATIVTWGGSGPAVAMMLGALAGGAAGMGIKRGLQGDNYPMDAFAQDLAMTLVTAASAGLAGPFSQIALQVSAVAKTAPALRFLIVQGLTGAQMGLTSGVALGLLDENTWRGSGDGLTNFLHHAGQQTLMGGMTGMVAGGTGRLLGNVEGASTVRKAVASGLGAATGGTANTLMSVDIENPEFSSSLATSSLLGFVQAGAMANLPQTPAKGPKFGPAQGMAAAKPGASNAGAFEWQQYINEEAAPTALGASKKAPGPQLHTAADLGTMPTGEYPAVSPPADVQSAPTKIFAKSSQNAGAHDFGTMPTGEYPAVSPPADVQSAPTKVFVNPSALKASAYNYATGEYPVVSAQGQSPKPGAAPSATQPSTAGKSQTQALTGGTVVAGQQSKSNNPKVSVPADHTAEMKQGYDSLHHMLDYESAIERFAAERQALVQGNREGPGDVYKLSKERLAKASAFLSSPKGQAIPDEHLFALKGYTGDDYTELNDHIDKGAHPLLSRYVNMVRQGLRALPDNPGKVYRASKMNAERWNRLQSAFKSGEAWSENQFLSSSDEERVARDFLAHKARGVSDQARQENGETLVFFKIQSKHGKDITAFSQWKGECEILFEDKTKFKPISIEEKNQGFKFMEVTLVEIDPNIPEGMQ